MITIQKMIARFPVTILAGDEMIQTKMTPRELLHAIATKKLVKEIEKLDSSELARAFYQTAEQDLMLAFRQNYDVWLAHYNNFEWSKRMFDKRIGKRGAMDFEIREDYEILRKMLHEDYKLLAQKYIRYGITWLNGEFDTYKGKTTVIEPEEDLTEKQLDELCNVIKEDSRVKMARVDSKYTIAIVFTC